MYRISDTDLNNYYGRINGFPWEDHEEVVEETHEYCEVCGAREHKTDLICGKHLYMCDTHIGVDFDMKDIREYFKQYYGEDEQEEYNQNIKDMENGKFTDEDIESIAQMYKERKVS